MSRISKMGCDKDDGLDSISCDDAGRGRTDDGGDTSRCPVLLTWLLLSILVYCGWLFALRLHCTVTRAARDEILGGADGRVNRASCESTARS